MKPLSLIIFIAIVAAAYYFVAPQIPPHIGIKNLEPKQGFGNTLRLTVTLSNFTPQTKTLYLQSSELVAATTIYIDHQKSPESTPINESTALATLELAPFSQQHYELALRLNEITTKAPLSVRGTNGTISITQGQHPYFVEIGGYMSGKHYFTTY